VVHILEWCNWISKVSLPIRKYLYQPSFLMVPPSSLSELSLILWQSWPLSFSLLSAVLYS
jgi:hypothetical protein